MLIGAGVLAFAVLIVVLGVINPPRPDPVLTDRLGPDRGQRISEYLAQSGNSLQGSDGDQHWALVSLTEYLTPQQIPATAGGLRISAVIQHVPIPRVQTPVVTVSVPAGDAAAVATAQAAAGLIQSRTTGDDRSARVIAVAANRLRGDCACTAGLIVRGTLPALRELATHNGIRGVQALPADAVWGKFAVIPLLPEWTDTAAPGPDDGLVPEN
ncbi:hypothetical protein D5S18_31325 [Nocardia panacis]|uniref:Uncharacterized protein n=1 Tax=Nocardia panacis TaxID=2340916 RepID=A0A3A4JTM3_9NOCA|nr:hypothetical protein D5S18_31325 [Nocardia panacis]